MTVEIKEVEINGKTYEIEKQGVSICMQIRSAFMWLIRNSQVDLDAQLEDDQFADLMLLGMYGDLVYRIKDIIIVCVPQLSKKYESLDPTIVMKLFLKINEFHISIPDKKKEKQK